MADINEDKQTPKVKNTNTGRRKAGGSVDPSEITSTAGQSKTPKNMLDFNNKALYKDSRSMPTIDWVNSTNNELVKHVLEVQKSAATHFYHGLVRLKDTVMLDLGSGRDEVVLPISLEGRLLLPNGAAGNRLEIKAVITGDQTLHNKSYRVALSDNTGGFTLRAEKPIILGASASLVLTIRGANGQESITLPAHSLSSIGVFNDVQLKLNLQPLPTSIIARLEELTAGFESQNKPQLPQVGTPEKPITVTLGENDCAIQFSNQLPVETHRYSVLFRLIEPRLSVLTEVVSFRDERRDGGDYWVANRNDKMMPGMKRSFAERVPIDQPISVDAFRDQVVGLSGDTIVNQELVPMAATLGLGYIVRMEQQWRPAGLSLGDLLYSLPLAPGEQQRIAVFEQKQSTRVSEFESLDFQEQQQERARSDSSTSAMFASAFAESVVGTSSFHTEAESSSWGVAGGIGIAIGPIVAGVGAGGGGGSSSSDGNSRNTLNGNRDFASHAASEMHASSERQASARRHAQRTGIRLATASTREQVTTKVITNNNRVHALTMQYWEVLRHYTIATEVNGVSLVCFVPLQVVRFLPPKAKLNLDDTQLNTRADILYRYKAIRKHSDILARWLPNRYRQGLRVLDDFASNPKALPAFESSGMETIQVSIKGGFIPTDEIYVTVISRRGSRVGPIMLTGSIPALPEISVTSTEALVSRGELLKELHKRRDDSTGQTLSATLALPEHVAVDDVIGFELTRRHKPLHFQFAPPKDENLQALLAMSQITFFHSTVADQIAEQMRGIVLSPSDLEQEIAGPYVWDISAKSTTVPTETFVQNSLSFNTRVQLPISGFPVAALTVRPRLRFNELLKIEQTLQYVVRNTVTYSKAVWSSLTPEERVMMLEGFTIGVPLDGISDETQHIPLLNCVANQVLGFYGNSLIMPFSIPAEIAAGLAGDQTDSPEKSPITSAKIQDALTAFHRTGFSPPTSHVVLPTHGVLGEAVLGRCPSAEKIDLTRFWNWGDSPIAQAADIADSVLNKGNSLLTGAEAPSKLAGQPTLINNVSSGPSSDATDALKLLLGARDTASFQDITGRAELSTLQGKTLDTAEKARADALATAQKLASQGMDKAVEFAKAKMDVDKEKEKTKQATGAAQQQSQQAQLSQHATQATARLQTGLTEMRTSAPSYLANANAKANPEAALSFARAIISSKFGGTVPVDQAANLFSTYQQFASGSSGALTQGSTAFLTALGLI